MPRRRLRPPDIDNLTTWAAAYVTPQQLAAYWQVHVVTIHRWLRQGELPGVRFRGAWRVRVTVARAFERRLFRRTA